MSSQPLSSRSRVNSSRGNVPASPAAGASTVPRATSMVSSSDGSATTASSRARPSSGVDLDGEEPLLRAVVAEDVGEARRHDGLEAVVEERPHGVLPRRARAEVRARPRGSSAPAYSGWLRTKSRSSRHSEKSPAPNPVRSTRLSQSDGMIWSVSTSERSSGTARPVTTVTGFHRVQVLGGGEVAGHRGGGGDGGGDEVGATAPALATLEVPVRGRGAALAHGELVGVHGQAHRAARLAPLEAGGEEDLVEPLGLGLGLHAVRAGHDEGPHARADVAAVEHRGGGPEVLDARVGARPDEDGVDRDRRASASPP